MVNPRVKGEEEYRALARALDTHTPRCIDDERFIAEDLERVEVTRLGLTVCNPCPIKALCAAYATKARPPAGIWAGKTYPASQRRGEKEQP